MHISKEPIQRDYQMNGRTLNVVQQEKDLGVLRQEGWPVFLLAVSGGHTTCYRNPQHAAAATDSLLPTSTIPRALFVNGSQQGAAVTTDTYSPRQLCRVTYIISSLAVRFMIMIRS